MYMDEKEQFGVYLERLTEHQQVVVLVDRRGYR
jgi:hypothetical protein